MSVINTNVKSLVSQESLRQNNISMSTAMERLSTGFRINSSKDDAAGLAISTRMTSQLRGFSQAMRNVNDGISMTQTADGSLSQVNEMLQRMRELAVQASSGLMGSGDRSKMQLEVEQLKFQINDVASSSNFNQIKLLDGSAKSLSVQSGVNAGEILAMQFDSVKTADIGTGVKASLSSSGGISTPVAAATSVNGALSAGALSINGVAVGESFAPDDSKSAGSVLQISASAIAKVAAINRVSAESGVVAKVGNTTAVGSAMTIDAGGVGTVGTISVNGVTTASITTSGTSLALSRKMVVDAINAISGQTGVKAIDSNEDKKGVELFAADGRNILLVTTTLSTATTGLGSADANYVGSFDLSSSTAGSSITIGGAVGAVLANSGLNIGSYTTDTATVTSKVRANAAEGVAPAIGTTGLLQGSTLVINGTNIGAASSNDDTFSIQTTASTAAASAIAIAAAINKKTSQTGVTATVQANVLQGAGFAAATAATIYINGQSIIVDTTTRDNVVTGINTKSGQTGVVASNYGLGVQLTAADGRNILIGGNTAAASLGLTGVTIGAAATQAGSTAFYSTVKLTSDKAFEVNAGADGVANFELLGFRQGVFGGSSNGDKVATVDVGTALGAQSALKVIDDALSNVASNQARAGAYSNRLEKIANVIAQTSESLSASRSSIQDADYATETSALAKSQIISQAATAMLAQANQSAQSVLALLK